MLRRSLFAAGCVAWMVLSAGFTAAAEKSLQTLATEASTLYQVAAGMAEPHERGRLFFMIRQRIEAIKAAYPQSLVAVQLGFGRYEDIDVAAVEREAASFATAYPGEALALREAAPSAGASGAALIPKFGGSSGAASSSVPSFGATTGSGTAGAAAAAGQAVAVLTPGLDMGKLVADAPTRLAQTELVRRLREAVVIVVDPATGFIGTGFFVSPDYLVTNAHVVPNAERVVIANKEIGVRSARVRYKGMSSQGKGIDAAILQADSWANPSFLPFAAADDLEEGQEITIAGYPGRAAAYDKPWGDFFALLGDNSLPTAEAIPNVKFDFGYVQSIFENNATGLLDVQEGVNTSHGNSGSPVINRCGAVVSLHYQGSPGDLDVTQTKDNKIKAVGDMSKFNYGISAGEVVKFLKAAGTPFSHIGGKCPAGAE